jgi:hypothetical protein
MLNIFELLFFGCWHHWESDGRVDLIDLDGDKIGRTEFCHCTKCGVPKSFTLIQ